MKGVGGGVRGREREREGERERQEAHPPHKQRVEEGYVIDRGGGSSRLPRGTGDGTPYGKKSYRGTSLIRKHLPLEPCGRPLQFHSGKSGDSTPREEGQTAERSRSAVAPPALVSLR